MIRRRFLEQSAKAALALGLPLPIGIQAGEARGSAWAESVAPEATLPGSTALTVQGDLAAQMVDGIHSYLHRTTEQAAKERSRFWNRNYASPEAYNTSVFQNRERLRKIIGAVDPPVEADAPELVASAGAPVEISRGNGYKVYAVRWEACNPASPEFCGLGAEGLLLEPDASPRARVVAIPDADWTPEMLAGLAPGVPSEAQFARRLAENRCLVLVPVLIDRNDEWSGIEGAGLTNEPHREWIYRMAFEVGRHIIGYEVQKVLAAVDWFARERGPRPVPIGVMGYGEGALLALYTAAVDTRIEAAVVSGYYQPREEVWKEPIYRDVWGLLREFGDAELAGLVSPRALIVEACRVPEVAGPPPATEQHKETACPNGKLVTPPVDQVSAEVERARQFFAGLGAEGKLQLVVSEGGEGLPGSESTLRAFLAALGSGADGPPPPARKPSHSRAQGNRAASEGGETPSLPDPKARLYRQFQQMIGFTQGLIRKSPERRKEFWATVNSAGPVKENYEPPSGSGSAQWSVSPDAWRAATQSSRQYIWEEIIGRLPEPSVPANPRTRLVYDEPKIRGYEVMLEVWPEVFAYGIILIPKDIGAGERRPVVVCQHGLEGRPSDVADPLRDSRAYHRFAARLAEEGFVTYAPQNPYIGEDRFRLIQRKAHPLKLALFSFIIGQHEQTLKWLRDLPFVDAERIGFYGLSYGGKTAVRVPPFLDGYALSICSGDFNEWVWKTTTVESHFSYLLTKEYDMYEFNFANVANYAELANLMAPRPFMVERGHYDVVAPDDEVAFEYAKVRWFYAYMGIPENTSIEFFSGPHQIHGEGTFEFLRRHLRWPPTPGGAKVTPGG